MKIPQKLSFDYYVGGALLAALKLPTVLLGKLLRRDHNLDHSDSVTFVKMAGGGSLVIGYPALLAIRNVPRIKRLRIITSPKVRPFAEILGIFDEIIVVRDDSVFTLGLDTLAALFRVFGSDAIVDLEIHSRLTTFLCLLSCSRNRIGFYTGLSFWRKGISTHLLFCNIFSGIYDFYDQIAMLFGGVVPSMSICSMTFRAKLAVPFLSPDVARLCWALAPCCSELGRERMLRPQEWIEVLGRRLPASSANSSVEICLMGSPADRAELETLSGLIGRELPGVIITNDAGRYALADSVRRLAQVGRLFCIDSALLHFARLLGIPTVSFWGPTTPQSRLRPSDFNRDEIQYHHVPCSPCVHLTQEAPCRGDNTCIRLAVNPQSGTPPNQPRMIAQDLILHPGHQSEP